MSSKCFLKKSFVFPVDLILLPTKAVPGLLLHLKGEPSVATEVKVRDLSGALYIKKKKTCWDRDKIRVDLQAHKFMALPSLDQVPSSGSVPPPCLKDTHILIHGGIGRVEQNSYILLLPLTLDPPQLSRSYESSEGSFSQIFWLDLNFLKILKILIGMISLMHHLMIKETERKPLRKLENLQRQTFFLLQIKTPHIWEVWIYYIIYD